MPKKRKWTEKQLIEAYNNSRSIRQILVYIGLKPAGGNYELVKKYLNKLGFKNLNYNGAGQSWRKGSKIPIIPAKPLKEILVENSTYTNTNSLRKRLLSENVFLYECFCCKLEVWLDKPIPLELDHINGVKTDNRIENLRLLCPNCHALTPTYRGKNIKKE